jgi:RNA polymerase sigma-70 factor (ECF subfamily)
MMAQQFTTGNLMLPVHWLDMSRDTPANNDETLVARCRQGEDEALRTIFERYARSINGFIYGMLGERDLAEELTQETFLRAYQKISTFRDASRLSTWLFGIAKNVARESLYVRRTKGHTHIEISDSSLHELSGHEPSPSARLLNKELHQVMLDALDKLDEDKRQVFTLKAFHHKRYDEIMEITGFSLSKVKSDLHRARAEMQRFVSLYTGGAR